MLYVNVLCHHSDGSMEGKLSRCKLGSMDHRWIQTVIYSAKTVDDVSLSELVVTDSVVGRLPLTLQLSK